MFVLRFRSEINRRKTAERAINQALAEAEAANQTKSAFIATISHEIRTPLTSILGTSQILEETNANAAQKNLVGHLHRSAQFLLKLLNDILDFSRYETGNIHVEEITFDPTELIDDVFSMMHDKAAEKELSFTKKCDPLPPLLMGDPFLIRQILTNLIDNAIKFTVAGSVSLEVFYLDKKEGESAAPLCFAVKDTGIGISPENQHIIFEAFKQEESGISRRYGGNGLGLAICSQLVERMNGEIILESTKGEGSTFSVVLMLPEASPQHLQTKNQPTPQAAALKILLVDDFESNRITISKLLQSAGHKVNTASSGEGAISKVIRDKYDLILMDIHMPGIDGIKASKGITELFLNNKNVPLIFAFTADYSSHAQDAYKAAGMVEVVRKPFDRAEFTNLLLKHFSTHTENMPSGPRRGLATHSNLLDMAVVAEYDALLSKDEFSNLFASYQVNGQETLELMKTAIESKALGDLNECTHRLSGASGIIGFKEMARWCQSLGEKAEQNGLKGLLLEIAIGQKILDDSLNEISQLDNHT